MTRERTLPRAAALLAAAVMLLAGEIMPAAAFPLLDPTNETTLPGAVQNLATPDAEDLQHQLQIANAFAAPAGRGWTILPRISLEEVFDDNEQQVTRPRQWDLATVVSPGVSVLGDLPRLQMRLDYAPAVEVNVPEGPQNALIQQLNGTALVTVVPDLAFLDLRALAGAQAINGLVGANGAVGNIGQIGTEPGLAAGSATAGLAKQNRVQTGSFSASPYLLRTFDDWGTGKLGTSVTVSSSDQMHGFATSPFPTGSVLGSSALTTEQTGQFTTGDFLTRWQDTLSFDLLQTTTSTNGVVSAIGQVASIPRTSFYSSRELVSDRLAYAVTDWDQLFVTFGHEDIRYSTAGFRSIDDLTWSVGTTAQPNPDSQLTVSYGHQNGANSAEASGRYALTARTIINGSYTERLGTQLEQIGNVVQAGVIGPSGQFIDLASGAPLLIPVYETETVPEVLRYRTFNLNLQTLLDRDSISLAIVTSQQNSTTSARQTNARVRSVSVQWRHDLSSDISLSAYTAFTQQSQGAGQVCTTLVATSCTSVTGGTTQSLVFGATLNYILTETVTANVRYLFSDRITPLANETMYQDLIIVGITKQF